MPPNDSENASNNTVPTQNQNTVNPIPIQKQSSEPQIVPPKGNGIQAPQNQEPDPNILPLPSSQTPKPAPTPSVQSEPIPETQTNQPSNPSRPTSKKGLLFTLLFMFIILPAATISAGLALAYNNYSAFKPPEAIQNALDSIIASTPLPKPPRIILASTVAKSAALKSADVKTEITISSDAKNAPVSEIKLTISGPADFESQNSRMAEADIGFEVKFEGAQFTGSGSIKTIDNTLYFKVDEVPFGQFYQQLLDYKGKWYYYKIPDQYIKQETSQPQMDKFKNLLTDFVKKSQDWTTVKSQNGSVYTLEIKPPKSEIDNLIFALIDAAQPQDQKQLVSDLEKQQLSKFTDKLANLEITAKVNKSNYYLQSANVSFNININDLGLPTSGITLLPSDPLVYKFNLLTELSNYNKKIVIVPPQDAQDFQKIIDQYTKQSTFMQDTQKGGILDAAIKNDIRTIATGLSAYYTQSVSQGQGTYPKNLNVLVDSKFLTTLPKPPADSGIDSYTYIVDPTVCDGSPQNPCREVALYSPLSNPTTFGNGWCWQSTTGKVQELPKEQCVATKAVGQTENQGQNSLRSLIAPDQTVLGQKTNWEQETIRLFKAFLK